MGVYSRRMKRLAVFFFLISFCAGTGKIWHFAKDGFSIRRCHVWDFSVSSGLSEESRSALNQTYIYLSRGHQCYAFVSEDGNYVIKIPRTDRYHTAFWLNLFPQRKQMRQKNLSRREAFLLESFRVSYEELRDQTALLALHLGKSEDRGEKIRIVDRIGRSYEMPLHNTAFILQRKKPILMAEFQKALREGSRDRAEQMLEAFLQVIVDRAKLGILNKDPSFLRNFGFDGKSAFQIDIGSFYRVKGISGRIAYEKSIRETVGPVREWLASVDREMAESFDQMLERFYNGPV